MSTAPQKKVGLIGLGSMGSAIASRIVKAGYTLVVYNRTASKAAELVKAGAKLASSPAELAKMTDIILLILMDDVSVLNCLQQSQTGLLAGLQNGAVVVNLTTISPSCTRELQRLVEGDFDPSSSSTTTSRTTPSGRFFFSSPVIGRPNVAAAGQLQSWVGGTAIDRLFESELKPLISVYSAVVHAVGDRAEQAAALKLAANFNILSTISTFGQTFALTEKYGINPAVTTKLLEGLFPHPGLQHYARAIGSLSFESEGGFNIHGGLKDAKLMLQASEEARCPLPSAQLAHQQLVSALALGFDQCDWSALVIAQRTLAGLDTPKQPSSSQH